MPPKINYLVFRKPRMVYDRDLSYTYDDLKRCIDPVELPEFDDIKSAIKDVQKCWDDNKFLAMLYSCKKECIKNIVNPFGLGKILSSYDKDGGNITTQHNADKGVYARPEIESYRHEQYHGSRYREARKRVLEKHMSLDGLIVDGYTGKHLNINDVDVDHVISSEEMHRSGGWMQTVEQRAVRGADERNLVPTDSSLNRSMRNEPIKEWMKKANTVNSEMTNAEYRGIDIKKLKNALARATRADKEHAPGTVDKTLYWIDRGIKTSFSEATRMGFQQALGIILTHFFDAVLDEVVDSYKNGFKDGVDATSIIDALQIRLRLIADRCSSAWAEVIDAFKIGATSGFLSNLLTAVVNIFITTSRRSVRMIREGFKVLMKAFCVLFDSNQHSLAESADAALKIVASGIVTTIGIMAEESIYGVIAPIFESFVVGSSIVPMLTAAITAGMTSICTFIVVYLVDKIDLFGVHRRLMDEYVIEEFRKRAENLSLNNEMLIGDINNMLNA